MSIVVYQCIRCTKTLPHTLSQNIGSFCKLDTYIHCVPRSCQWQVWTLYLEIVNFCFQNIPVYTLYQDIANLWKYLHARCVNNLSFLYNDNAHAVQNNNKYFTNCSSLHVVPRYWQSLQIVQLHTMYKHILSIEMI
jgi:hypothetical protein